MSGQHTPGPWGWFANGNRVYLATPNRGRLYVMGFARQGMQGAGPRFAHWEGMDEGKARERMGGIMEDGPFMRDGSLHPDARLIAAAPELLEALQSLLQHVEHADSCGDHDAYNHASVPTCGCGLDSALELAQAAIAKATQP